MLEPLSPELVLVSPDLAESARAALPPVELWSPRPVVAAPRAHERLPFAIFCTVCATTTLAPLALIAAIH
jgi:hypothetical protein